MSWGKDTGGKNQGSKVYTAVAKMRDAGVSNEGVLRFVKSVYPGWNFAVIDPGKQRGFWGRAFFNWFDAYAEGEKEWLAAWPGSPIELKAKDGSKAAYYDARSGKVYAGNGRVISDNLAELQAYFAKKTIAELDAEAGGTAK